MSRDGIFNNKVTVSNSCRFSVHWASCLFVRPRAKSENVKYVNSMMFRLLELSNSLCSDHVTAENRNNIVMFRRMCFCSIYRFGLMTVQIKVHVREILASIKLLARELL